jgi:predicted alpha/beta-hydrolase family hydrolase
MRLSVETPVGLAEVDLAQPRSAGALVAVGHGAGGGIDAPDIVAATKACTAAGFAVARVVQPYRVAGRRAPGPAAQLDAAWIAVLRALRRRAALAELPLVTAGRSSGARVACRTAAEVGAVGVVCLAFPLHPPGSPDKSRLPELEQLPVPVLIVQGDRDPFGMPPATKQRTVLVVPGADHGLKRDTAGTGRAVAEFVRQLTAPSASLTPPD